MYHEKCGDDEKFIGNTTTMQAHRLPDELEGVKFRLGNIAYDIHGNPLDKREHLPVFVKKESLKLYDEIMMAQMAAIRKADKWPYR